MFCAKCGIANSIDARYCNNCGTALLQVKTNPSKSPHVAENSKVIDADQESGKINFLESNFIVKHWRGDYSLVFSYWIIGSLLSVIVVAITMALGSSNELREFGARGSGLVILALNGFAVTLAVWQLVGIWRSADKHCQRRGKILWARLAKMMVVLGLLGAVGEFSTQGIPIVIEGAKLFVGIDSVPPHQIRLLRNDTELELAGGMAFGTTDAVIEALDSAPSVQIIHLNSNGGRINEAYKLYKVIKERNLITYTSADCVSACSIAFLAGRERYLGESGRLGFHSTSIGGLGGEIAEELNDEVRQTLRIHGVPNNFIDRALSTSPKNMWYPSKDELLRAKVIDSVVDSRYFGLSGVAQWRDARLIEAGLLTNPIYSALAKYDQQNYSILRNVVVSGVQKGRASIDIQNEVRSIFAAQIPEYLKKAPDEALIRYWRTKVEEMEYLEKLDPQQCADFAFPEFASSAQDLQRLLPNELLIDDMNALAAVVEGVATNPQPYRVSSQIQSDLDLAMEKVAQKYPWVLEVVQNPADYKNDPASLCGAVIALISEVLTLPSSDRSGGALRYAFSE